MKNFIVVLASAGLFALVGCSTTTETTTTTTTETKRRSPSASMDPTIDNTRSTPMDMRGPR